MDITRYIENHIDLANVLRTSSKEWDGGYVMCGLTGSGETFAVRDPWGIRTAFWYQDDEIAVLASERPVIQTALNVSADRIRSCNRDSFANQQSRQAPHGANQQAARGEALLLRAYLFQPRQ